MTSAYDCIITTRSFPRTRIELSRKFNSHAYRQCLKIEARLEKFLREKHKNGSFQQSHSAEKSKRRDPLGIFNIRSVANYHKSEGRSLW